jgi:hypothetical protein
MRFASRIARGYAAPPDASETVQRNLWNLWITRARALSRSRRRLALVERLRHAGGIADRRQASRRPGLLQMAHGVEGACADQNV